MRTTAEFLDDLRRVHNLESDYQVAKLLQMHRQAISRYRQEKGTFDDQVAIRIAELLKVEPGYVLACMHAQRANEAGQRKVWERIAKRLATAAMALLAAVPLGAPTTAEAARNQGAARGEVEARCIMLNRIRRFLGPRLLGVW
jgi:predicted transcriptional regulator